MAVTSWSAGELGPNGPQAPLPVPVGSTTVDTTNPNPFPVVVTPKNTTSNATITSVSINDTQVQTTGGVAVTVPPGGKIKCTYASGTTTYPITVGAIPVLMGQYPFTDPVFQNFTTQQYLTQTGVNASGTFD
jgi:hypothetical protein